MNNSITHLFLRTAFPLFAVVLFFIGCAKKLDIQETQNTTSTLMTKAQYDVTSHNYDLSKAIYHLSTETWIIPQNDPYDLNRILEARDKVGLSSDSCPINATHYAIKFFPKNEEEQWAIELLEGIKVDYTPFNYQLVNNTINQELGAEPKNRDLVLDDCRYFISYPCVNEDGLETNETYRIPVLYTVWPIEKPLPESFEYEIDHMVFIPDYRNHNINDQKKKALKLVEREAIHLALGYYPSEFSNPDRSNDVVTLQGYIYHYEPFLDTLVGQQNLKLRFQLGSNIHDTYVQQSGLFSITEAISTAASFKHVFQHPKWKLTYNNSTNPIEINWGEVSYWWPNANSTPVMSPGSSNVQYDVLPAVNFYYSGSHSIRTWYYESGMRIIIACENSGSSTTASFYYGASPTYIKVYENQHGNENLIMGSVLHELGHFTMYGECGGYNNYVDIDKLLRESYASYVGWYLTKTRYSYLGYTESPSLYDFTGQSRQSWRKTGSSTNYYSPLFVDLVDTLNQSSLNSYCNNDQISISSSVHYYIRQMAAQCKTWGDIKSTLSSFVGLYYTQSEYNSFIAPYNYWYEHI